MPVAVVQEETRRFDVKSAPPDGYVIIRSMSYGERMQRSNLTGSMKMLRNQKSDYVGEMAMEMDRITLWDFAHLVVEHNMQDTDGRTLNFKNPVDVNKLSSKIGDEIGNYIDEVNNFEDIEAGNSSGGSGPTSS